MDRCVIYCSLFCLVDIFLTCYPFPQRASALVPAKQGFLHFNNLWCYLFYKLTGQEMDNKGITAFSIVLSKNLTITTLLDRVFPAIASIQP